VSLAAGSIGSELRLHGSQALRLQSQHDENLNMKKERHEEEAKRLEIEAFYTRTRFSIHIL
jgi:hypothetical protein